MSFTSIPLHSYINSDAGLDGDGDFNISYFVCTTGLTALPLSHIEAAFLRARLLGEYGKCYILRNIVVLHVVLFCKTS